MKRAAPPETVPVRKNDRTQTIALHRTSLPILHDCDVLVVDGSLAGIAAAVTLARSGRRVALVESRTYLGRDLTATLRPWLRRPDGDATSLPSLLQECIEASGTALVDGEWPLHMDAVKVRLEDLLLEAGVRLVYGTRPVGIYRVNGTLRGAVVANKSGRQAITCRAVIDASTTALATRVAGATFDESGKTGVLFRRTVEFEKVVDLPAGPLVVPPGLGIAGNAVTVHRGCRGASHVLLEHAILLPRAVSDAVALAEREAAARRVTQALVDHLYAHEASFLQAVPGASSYELSGPGACRMAAPPPPWASGLGRTPDGLPAAAFAGPVPGLWCINDAARLDEAEMGALCDPAAAVRTGEALAQLVHAICESVPAAVKSPAPVAPAESALQVREQDRPRADHPYDRCETVPLVVPVAHATDVLVVGGGSSGSMAAFTAARAGARTTLIDMNPGLGGTGTYGGIDLLWFPRPIGCFNEFYGRISRMQERLHLPRPKGIMPSYAIAARLRVLMDAAEDAGVAMLLNSVVIGTIVEHNSVRGAVVATPLGPVAVLAQVVVDATGDGDVAAFAGAEYVLGSDRENAVMYALMPEGDRPGRFLNVKTSMLDVSDVEDWTRMILAERRRHRGTPHDHAIYLAPRESRHVLGEVRLTLTDQLVQRCWRDVVYVAFSNCDMKGPGASDWQRMGLQSPNYEIEIPYRALLPRGLDGILVAGKAYSATHDAIAAPRMQPDLENLGGVAGTAAALAVREAVPPHQLDIRMLQQELVRRTFLPATVLARELAPAQRDEAELRVLIDSLDASQPLSAYSDHEVGERYEERVPLVDVLCAGPRAVPLLCEALAGATGRRKVLLAQALAAVGSAEGVPVLVDAIMDELAGGVLPPRTVSVKHAGLPPNQGAAPYAAHLVHSLGMAADERALPVWERVVDLLAATTPELIVDKWQSHYCYIDAVCCGAERLGSPGAVALLSRLHGYAPLRRLQCESGWQVDWFEERRAYLELVIGRALARCGSVEGLRILVGYLSDNRAILARHAHAELRNITGQDFGRNTGAWREWVGSLGDTLKPVPWRGVLEPMAAWGEEMLTVVTQPAQSRAAAAGAR